MKTIIFLYLLLSLPVNHLFSQNGWVQVNPGFGHSYNSVHFYDLNYGMACGNGGAIVYTTNGGINWFNSTTGTVYTLNDIRMFSSSVAIAAGDNQLILRTTNGGNNWTIVNQGSPVNNSITNLSIFNDGSAAAFSTFYQAPYEYTYIYRSSNMGLTWQISQTFVANRWIHFLNLNTGWAYGSTSTGPPLNQYYLDVNQTTNGGQNWFLINRGPGVSINPGMIYFFDASFGFKYSHIGIVYTSRSLDGGNTWISTGIPNLYNLVRSFYFISSLKGWLSGDNSIIYHTTNSGVNWIQQTSPVSANMNEIYFINENTGWVAAGSQGLLKTSNGGVTNINIINTSVPSHFQLSQNYPNPFNPATKIKFAIPAGFEAVQTLLSVYDLLGREVAVLVNEKLRPGTYEVDWDASVYQSGVYFYTITSASFKDTRKMVLLK